MMAAAETGTSIIFYNSNGEVLLFLRDDKQEIPFPNCWDLLGGHAETGETPERCIQREILEEIEVELGVPSLFRAYAFEDRNEYTFWQRSDLDIANLTLHEGQRLKWFSRTEILAMTDAEIAFGFRRVLLEFYDSPPWKEAGTD
jgi:8-oxo-dGTP diphosphatase